MKIQSLRDGPRTSGFLAKLSNEYSVHLNARGICELSRSSQEHLKCQLCHTDTGMSLMCSHLQAVSGTGEYLKTSLLDKVSMKQSYQQLPGMYF